MKANGIPLLFHEEDRHKKIRGICAFYSSKFPASLFLSSLYHYLELNLTLFLFALHPQNGGCL